MMRHLTRGADTITDVQISRQHCVLPTGQAGYVCCAQRSCFNPCCAPPRRDWKRCSRVAVTGGVQDVQVPAKSGDSARTRSLRDGGFLQQRCKEHEPLLVPGAMAACFGRSDDEPFFIVRVATKPKKAVRAATLDADAGIKLARGDLVFSGVKLAPMTTGGNLFEFAKKGDSDDVQDAMRVRVDEVRLIPVDLAPRRRCTRGKGSESASAAASAASDAADVFSLSSKTKMDILYWCSMFDVSPG